MKIFFAIKALDGVIGGAERVLTDISSGLANRGHDVSIITYDKPGGVTYYSLHNDIKRLNLGIGETTQSTNIVETVRRIVALRNVIKTHQPDVIVGFMHSMFIPLGFAAMGTGIPVIASEHTVQDHYRHHPYQNLMLAMTPFITSCIVVVSDQVKDSYPERLRKHMITILNPLQMNSQDCADVRGTENERKILLSVGNLTPLKDHKTLLQAFSVLADEFPDWDLRIVGEGGLRLDLEKQIQNLGLNNRVQLPGINPDINSEYAKAQLYVVPSLYESFGMATAEALAHGLPVTGFADCPGTNVLVKHNTNGILASGNNRADTLANSLKLLMSDPVKRSEYGKNASLGMEAHAINAVLDKWEKLLLSYIK